MKCVVCGVEFDAKRKTAKYCSTTCRKKASRGDYKAVNEEVVMSAKPIKNHDKARDELNKKLAAKGLPQIIRGSEMPPIEFVSSGVPQIDEMTGGFPRARVTEIYGPKGVGKTSLMSKIVGSLPGLKILYIDAEGGMPVLGEHADVVSEHMLESVEELVDSSLQANTYDLIVVDSIASLIPRAEIEGDPGDAHMGLKAKLMSQWMRRVIGPLGKSRVALVFINQQRDSMSMYGPPKFTPGGHGVPYAASLRLELRSNKVDKLEGGQWVHVEVEKSRVCKPYQKTKFKLVY